MRCKDLLGIDEPTYAKIRADLSAQSAPASRRAGELCFNLETPIVAIFNHNDPKSRAAYQVRPIDISARELRFLHGGLEPKDTPLVALIREESGNLRMVSGRVGATRLVTGKIRAVVMRFQEGIDPAHFVPLAGLSDEARRDVSLWHQKWKSLIRLDDEALFDLMRQIRTRDDRQEFRVKRGSPRLEYCQGAILVVLNPEEASRCGVFRVPTMDLSAGGLGFLHGTYIHTGTPCDMLLTTVDGRTEIVHGRVARCEVAQGTIHQVGVRFEEPIQVRRFLAGPGGAAADAA